MDETFYFGTGESSRKGRNLAADLHLVMHSESGDGVVILEGVAEVITDPDPDLSARIAGAYASKYLDSETGEEFSPGSAEGMFAVCPRVVFGWLEHDLPRTATRWFFGDS